MIRYICRYCGHVLYETNKINFLTTAEVSELYNHKCPNCGKRLEPLTTSNWKERIIIKVRKVMG